MGEPARSLRLAGGDSEAAGGGRRWSPKVVLMNRVIDDLHLAGCSASAGVVWAVLYRHADASSVAVQRVSNERLADEAGLSVATVKRAKSELKTRGLLADERGGGRKANRYLLCVPRLDEGDRAGRGPAGQSVAGGCHAPDPGWWRAGPPEGEGEPEGAPVSRVGVHGRAGRGLTGEPGGGSPVSPVVSASVEGEPPPPERGLWDRGPGSEQRGAVAAVLMSMGFGGHDAMRLAKKSGATVEQAKTVKRNMEFLAERGEIRKTPVAYASHCLLTGRWSLDGRVLEAEELAAKKARAAEAAEREAGRAATDAAKRAAAERQAEARLAAMGADEVAAVCDAVIERYALTLIPAIRSELEGRRLEGRWARGLVVGYLMGGGTNG